MKYVIDSSVSFKWVVAENDSDKAQRLRADFRNGVHDLLAADIFPAEVANALLMAERRGRINPGELAIHVADILSTTPRLEPTSPLLQRVAEIVATFRISIYDCLYVALAEREACDFVTADEKLVKKLQAQFPFLVSLAALP